MARERIVPEEPKFLERVGQGTELAPMAVAMTAPRSMAADRYRLLHFRLERLSEQHGLRCIAVASASSGDGRTTTALNLALTAARSGDRRVILVECDLRHPCLERLLGLPEGPGLADLLDGEAEIESCVRRLARPALHAITAGRRADEAEVDLDGRRLKALIALLKHKLDEIYLDMPPLLESADASVVASTADAALLVLRPRRSLAMTMR
ncbi:MAG: CpsD/CapB family tyrosine-protein kinase, partial [Deltaproteobacteria bacterium]